MEQKSGKTLSATVRQTLTVVRSVLSGPGGVEAALRLLERRVHEQVELSQSAAIWACISSLREQVYDKHNKDGVMIMREVSERANMLRMAPVRVLMFDDMDSSSSLFQQDAVMRRNFNDDDDEGESCLVEKRRFHKQWRRLSGRCSELIKAIEEDAKEIEGGEKYGFDADRIDGRGSNNNENRKGGCELYLERCAILGKCTATLLGGCGGSDEACEGVGLNG